MSAAAPITTTTATATTTASTEPKVNGQIDERTGVAPVAAQATIGGVCPTASEFGICILKHYPLCQYTHICEGSSSAALSCELLSI